MQLSNFLRAVLKLDAASCLMMAAASIIGAEPLEPILGIPASLLASAGLSLVPIGIFILWLGTRERAAAALVYLVIAGNAAWAAGTIASLALLPAVSTLGAATVIGQASVVAVFALVELRGARESRWASAS